MRMDHDDVFARTRRLRTASGNVVELVERLQLNLATENEPLDPPGKNLEDLVMDVDAGRDCEDVV